MTGATEADRLNYLRGVVALWRKGAAVPALSRLDFLRELAARAAHLGAVAPPSHEAGLQLFRDLIMGQPEDLRRRLLGENAMRRRQLSPLQRRALQSLDVWPDLLSPMGQLRYEPAHSHVIAHLISPARLDDFGVDLLNALLAAAGCGAELRERTDLETAKVTAERALAGKGRVDIEISTRSLLAYVECKVDADEGAGQLLAYRSALKKAAGARATRLIYLTLPDAKAPGHPPDAALTFEDLLLAWLPFAAQTRGPSGLLERYTKSIALLVDRAGVRAHDDWTYAQQRAALHLVARIEEV